jgi:phytoene synthase
VVGEVAAGIFGGGIGENENHGCDERTRRYAHTLGLAFQLTNIIRDVGDDARRGRIYLPLEDLGRFAISPADIDRPDAQAKWRALMKFEVSRTRALMLAGPA